MQPDTLAELVLLTDYSQLNLVATSSRDGNDSGFGVQYRCFKPIETLAPHLPIRGRAGTFFPLN